MLADMLTLVGAASTALVGAVLVLMIVLHAYARWTIREIDRDSGVAGLSSGRAKASGARALPSTPARQLDGDFQSADACGVDPDTRITLDDPREDAVAVWAAENNAGAPVDMNGPDRSGRTTADRKRTRLNSS